MTVGRTKQLDEKLMRELYDLELPDKYIARMCNTHDTRVRDWREANNLPVISPKRRRIALEKLDSARENKIFDHESLFHNNDFVNNFVAGKC